MYTFDCVSFISYHNLRRAAIAYNKAGAAYVIAGSEGRWRSEFVMFRAGRRGVNGVEFTVYQG